MRSCSVPLGGLTLGMMTRTMRGHMGAPLDRRRCRGGYVLLIQIAALVRVFGGIAVPDLYMASVQLAALSWAAAFGLYALRYWPVLTRPRLDGKLG